MWHLQAAYGVLPGNHISIKSNSHALHLTLAYAAVSSFVAAIQEWRDLHSAKASPICCRASACSASIKVIFTHASMGAAMEASCSNAFIHATSEAFIEASCMRTSKRSVHLLAMIRACVHPEDPVCLLAMTHACLKRAQNSCLAHKSDGRQCSTCSCLQPATTICCA